MTIEGDPGAFWYDGEQVRPQRQQETSAADLHQRIYRDMQQRSDADAEWAAHPDWHEWEWDSVKDHPEADAERIAAAEAAAADARAAHQAAMEADMEAGS